MKDGICKLKKITGVPDIFEINAGVSRLAGWPDDAAAAMSPKFPKDLGLADSLYGAIFVVVSAKVHHILEPEGGGRVEFLPLKIHDHKGRLASDEYFVVNPLAIVDCIDETASLAVRDEIDENSIESCAALVLREDAVSAGIVIFRPEHWRSLILIRRALADKLTAAGLTALRFIEPDKYTGLV